MTKYKRIKLGLEDVPPLSAKLDGTYYYVKSENSNSGFLKLGREMGCAIIGQFEFKNSKCYVNIMGVERRLEYDIDDNTIYFKESIGSNIEVGINIIDDNTIEYMGCTFKKDGVIDNKIEDDTPKDEFESTNLSKDSYSREPAIIKDIIVGENKLYIVVDVVQIKYIDDLNDYKMINQNPKLRTYRSSSYTKIIGIRNKTTVSLEYIIDNKEKIIDINRDILPSGFCMISTNKDGELIEIDFGGGWN